MQVYQNCAQHLDLLKNIDGSRRWWNFNVVFHWTENRTHMLDSKYVDHHIEILNQNRNYIELVIYMRLFTKAEVLLKNRKTARKVVDDMNKYEYISLEFSTYISNQSMAVIPLLNKINKKDTCFQVETKMDEQCAL